jgi:Neuraminidase (sialidase)
MKRVTIFWIAIILFSGNSCYTQANKPAIQVGKNILIKSNQPSLPITEPFLAINPGNSNHMVAAAIVSDIPNDPGSTRKFMPSYMTIFTTFDGGENWMQHDLRMKMAGDPWLCIRPDGRVLLTLLGMYDSLTGTHMTYYSSGDGGRTWTTEIKSLGSGFDHQTMDIDNGGRIYLTAVQEKKDTTGKARSYVYLNYSDDGISFQESPSLLLPNDLPRFTQMIRILPDGSVLIPYYDMHQGAVFVEKREARVVKTTDAGKTFSESYLITSINSPDLATIGIDTSSLFKNRIYYLNTTGKGTIITGPSIHFSDDMGKTWKGEIIVDSVRHEKFIRRAPQIAVNKNGIVGICWIDRQEDSERKKSNVWFTISTDGGKTFLPKVKVSEQSADPATTLNGFAEWIWPSGGDYFGLVTKADGSFQLLWSDSRTGVYQLFTACITIR